MVKPLDFEDGLQQLQADIDHLQRDGEGNVETSAKVAALHQRLLEETVELYAGLTPWQKVQVARHPDRPSTLDYLRWAFSDFVELHGDRRYGDDGAIVGGPAYLDGRAVMVVGHQKGRDTRENIQRHFGMAHPEGHRKAERLYRMAEALALPVLTIVDTPGAAVTVAAEERGQVESIAACLATLAGLRVPIIAVVVGQGGSGGALALSVADRILMLEHSYFSVAAPEAAASIIGVQPPDAAAAMAITPRELLSAGIIDGIIPEPAGGAHRDHAATAAAVRERVVSELLALLALPPDELVARRYAKYRHLGPFSTR